MNCKPYIRAHADELLESLAALVRIPSVEGVPEEHAPFGREPARALHETLALCEKLGFRTGNMDDRVGWCEYGEGEEMVAVLGHLDVVPAGDGWTETEPFSGEIKNGRIYGRGTMDDKGPMVAAIYALAALKDAGFAPSKRIRLLFGTNEETGCGDMSWYVSHGGELPVYGFTPDGEYPIINGEKGILNGTYSRKLHQTGDYRLTKFEGGAASNISPAYAAAELQCPADAASKIAADKVNGHTHRGRHPRGSRGHCRSRLDPGAGRKCHRTAGAGTQSAAADRRAWRLHGICGRAHRHGGTRRVPRSRHAR